MEAIILAGGFGTRLRSVVSDVPKPMAPIGNRPFLEILLKSLYKKNFSRVIISLGFMAETVSKYFGNRFSKMDLIYVVEDKPLGTGGAIRLAMEKATQDHVFIFNGDTFLDLEVDQLEELWQQKNNPIIVGKHIEETDRYGRLIVNDGYITGFAEKGTTGPGLINAGCYILPADLLSTYHINKRFSFEEDFLAHKIKDKSINFFETSGLFIDIGVPDDYIRAKTLLKNL